MGRFLFFISYIGSKFSGIQRQKQEAAQGIKTVASVLEESLRCLRPKNDVYVVSSSRTDAGVHAMCNTVQCDLHPSEQSPLSEYDVSIMCHGMNSYFRKNHHDVRILKILRVNDDFHCRFLALSRTYCYKICQMRSDRLASVIDQPSSVIDHPFLSPCSAINVRRTTIIPPDCDLGRFKEATKILSGTHDFSAFASRVLSYQNPVKTMKIKLQSAPNVDDYLADHVRSLDHYDVIFSAKSFLQKQIRMMMGAMVYYGRGGMTLSHLNDLLTNPQDHTKGNTRPHCLAPSGLYLLNIEYKPEDLIYDPSRILWTPRTAVDQT